MGEFSLTHLLLLGIIVLIFFGPSRLPQLGQSLGKAIRGFKQGLSEIDAEAKDVSNQANSQIPQNQQQQLGQNTNNQNFQGNGQTTNQGSGQGSNHNS